VVDIVALASGNSTIVTRVTGDASAEFTLVLNTPQLIQVQSSQSPPAVPQILSVVFADDAGRIVLSFDSWTDQGGLGSRFACAAVLSFTGMETSQCKWANSQSIAIYPSAEVSVGSTVMVLAGVIRAQCVVLHTPCSQFGTVLPDSSVAAILAPASPQLPLVALSYSSKLGSCDHLVIDVTASTGAGGRQWQFLTFSVTTEPAGVNTSALVAFLNDDYVLSPPSAIAPDLLVVGTSYTITVTLCNFLGGCGFSRAYVEMEAGGSGSLPTIAVFGSPTRSIMTRDQLLLAVQATTTTCNGTQSTADLTYSWRIFKYGQYEQALVSESADVKKFKLSPLLLEPGSWYLVRARVVHGVGVAAAEAFASVTVTVVRGNLIAAISGGSQQNVRLGELLELDGSQSYDEDYLGTGYNDYDVSVSWTCTQLLPVYSIECPFAITGKDIDGSIGVIDARNATASVDSMVRVTLTLTDETRSGSSFVELLTVDAAAPVVQISSSTSPVNPTTVLRIRGVVSSTVSCDSRWNVSDDTIDLQTATLTAVSRVVPMQSVDYPVNLVLGAGMLAPRTSYRFTLFCGTALASVDVATNGPPQYGAFTVQPLVGVELETLFSLRVESWFDVHSPLSYQFEYFTAQSLRMVLQGRSEKTFSSSLLPATADGTPNITCRVVVYDALGCWASADFGVTVTTSDANHNLTAVSASIDEAGHFAVRLGVECGQLFCCAELHDS